jgi:hypothetical protein
MKFRFIASAALGSTLCFAALGQDAAHPVPGNPPQGPGTGFDRGQGGGRGFGSGMMGGRGVVGTVKEVAADHYVIKNETGEMYTVHFSANTRIVKQPASRQEQGGERIPPQSLKASDIKVGDPIAANGDVDTTAKSVGAVFVVLIDPERAKQMREMQANFGKTWLMGKVIAVHEVKVTLQSPVDNTPHTFVADENTSFRRRREMVTLADVQVGDNVRVEGALKGGVFMAASVAIMGPSASGGPAQRQGPPPQ